MKTLIRDFNLDDVTSQMRRMLREAESDDNISSLADSIVRNDPISDIYDWMKAHVSYVPDPDNLELFQHPSRMVRDYNEGKSLAGDCDDHALLAAALLKAAGVKSSIALLDTKGEGLDHASAQAWSKLGWIFVDSSTNKVPLGWTEEYRQIIIV